MLDRISKFYTSPFSLKKWLVSAFLFFLFWVSIMIWINAQNIIRSIFLRDFYLYPLSESIYIDREISQQAAEDVFALYQSSQKRIDSLFGKMKSQPILIIATTSQTLNKFGTAQLQTGMTHLTPLGSYIILAPDGTNIDVMSHEMCHAELLNRVGWWRRRQKIPIWFDEGLAMQVDYRFAHWSQLDKWLSQTQIKTDEDVLPKLEELQTHEQFFTSESQLHYFIAQKELRNWYKQHQQKGLLYFIEQLQDQSFEETYQFSKKNVILEQPPN